MVKIDDVEIMIRDELIEVEGRKIDE